MHILRQTFFIIVITVLISAVAVAGDYVIGEGDSLSVSVWGVDRLNFSTKVRPDGKITVPGLGDIKASGFTPKDLQKELTIKLKDLVKNPIVSVTVSDIVNSRAYIFGSGVKPGIYDVNRKTSLLQVLCSLSEIKNADLRHAYLQRDNRKIKEDFYNLFINGVTGEDILVEANDTIFIPVLRDKYIYVLGEVNSPKAIEFREGISVLDVILESGWFTKFANKKDIFVVRNEAGKEIKTKVNIKELINKHDLQQNIRLQPGDYIFIDESLF